MGGAVGTGIVLSGDPQHELGVAFEFHVGVRLSRRWALFGQLYNIDVRSGPAVLVLPAVAVQFWPRGGAWWLRASAGLGSDGIAEEADDKILTAATGFTLWRRGRFAVSLEVDGYAQWWRPIETQGGWYTSVSAGVGLSFGPRGL